MTRLSAVVAIGDLHARPKALRALLDKLQTTLGEAKFAETALVFLGDYVGMEAALWCFNSALLTMALLLRGFVQTVDQTQQERWICSLSSKRPEHPTPPSLSRVRME